MHESLCKQRGLNADSEVPTLVILAFSKVIPESPWWNCSISKGLFSLAIKSPWYPSPSCKQIIMSWPGPWSSPWGTACSLGPSAACPLRWDRAEDGSGYWGHGWIYNNKMSPGSPEDHRPSFLRVAVMNTPSWDGRREPTSHKFSSDLRRCTVESTCTL